jgi:hypothetical protein
MSNKEIIDTAIKLVGEMWRSNQFNEVTPNDISFEAIRMAILLKKELKEQAKN